MGQKIKPQKLKGFRDYPPRLQSFRESIVEAAHRFGHLHGFQAIGTPSLEYAQTLLGPGGDETDKQVFRFIDHGDREVALRFDLTVPLARFIAEHQGDLHFPFKSIHVGHVWRGEKPQKGRYREFCQCDFDVLGVDSLAADVAILDVIAKVLGSLDTGGFTIRVGHRKILSALIRHETGIDAGEEAKVLIAVDKLDKIGTPAVCQLIADKTSVPLARAETLIERIAHKNELGDSDLQDLGGVFSDEESREQIQRLQRTLSIAREVVAENSGKIHADMSIARGLGYYTGIVFETVLDELAEFGSISSGGRYNQLASRFVNRELPGIGASIGVDRLVAAFEAMDRLGNIDKPPVFVAIATQDAVDYGFQVANMLREQEIPCDVGVVAKVANQFRHADRRGCAVVITVGTEEKLAKTCSIKNLADGTERKGIALSQVAKELEGMSRKKP